MKPTPTLIAYWRGLPSLAAAFVITGVRVASAADYPTTILADKPLAYWRLDETAGNSTATDSSASGLYSANYIYSSDGLYPVLGAPGIDTNSISLSASDAPDYVQLPYNSDLNQPGPFSFEIWIRPTSEPAPGSGAYRCPIGNSAAYDTATQSGWYVYQTPDSPSELALVTPTGDVFITTTNYKLFNWYYLAGTYDGTNMSFYLNGVLVGTQRASVYVANSVNNAGACSFSLGQRGDGYGNFDGGLDDAAFYTNALTAAQILTHYSVGTNSFRAAPLPPTILNGPAPATIYAGQTATFSVEADGSTPLFYQWYNGTSIIAGATNAAYDFATTPAEDGNSYSVVVTNFVGSATSSIASLTVSTGLQIDASPTSIVREVGSSAAFEVVAEGAVPITYQWYNGADGSIIPGATNNVLWLYNVQLTNDSDSYFVEIINPYTSLPSSAAALNVNPRSVSVATNGYAQVVMADQPTAYWRLDETSGNTTAVDAVGSFDGTYVAGAGSFTSGVTPGIPHDADPALGVTGGATIQVPYAIEINPTGPLTVEGWFNAASVTAGGNDYRVPISSMSNPGIGPTGWLVYQTAFNNWSWWPYNGYYGGVQLTDYAQIVAGQWYYLTLVYDGTTFTFYVNGVAQASGTDSGFVQNGNVPAGGAANYNYNYTGSGNMVFGQRVDNAFNPFSGTIDDIAVYNKALTPQQIQNHFLNTTHLTIANSGKNFVISWSTGTLQSSTNAAGPYVNVTGATSPYTNTISGKQVFFRAQLQ
jgi:hypothetical protein